MKVRDNLAFGLKLQGCRSPRSSARQRRREAARDRAAARPLSAPALGRAVAARRGRPRDRQEAAGILFDEPLSNLDAKLRASMRVRITELHQWR